MVILIYIATTRIIHEKQVALRSCPTARWPPYQGIMIFAGLISIINEAPIAFSKKALAQTICGD
jgi:hypothetical protein